LKSKMYKKKYMQAHNPKEMHSYLTILFAFET
jgi:hypothetical protein